MKMNKCVVITTGDFGLLSPLREAIRAHGQMTVVYDSPFVASQLADKKLQLVAKNLPPEASDDELMRCLKESKGKADLALNAFCALYGVKLDGSELGEHERELKPATPPTMPGGRNATVLNSPPSGE